MHGASDRVLAFNDERRESSPSGARGDGKTNDTAAIQAAIDAAAGGGVVRFPAGEYLSGTLRLRSRLVLRLEAGAPLLALLTQPSLKGQTL